jgi:hypothetical protein
MIHVEVAYAKHNKQLIIPIDVETGTTVIQAIKRSGILEEFKEIDIENCDVGVFGKQVKGDNVLKEGDRVEIYRQLIADPKEVRKKRAAEGKRMSKGGGDAE